MDTATILNTQMKRRAIKVEREKENVYGLIRLTVGQSAQILEKSSYKSSKNTSAKKRK